MLLRITECRTCTPSQALMQTNVKMKHRKVENPDVRKAYEPNGKSMISKFVECRMRQPPPPKPYENQCENETPKSETGLVGPGNTGPKSLGNSQQCPVRGSTERRFPKEV